MLTYLTLLVGTVIVWAVVHAFVNDTNKARVVFIVVMGSILAVVMGTRAASVGTDTAHYLLGYNQIKQLPLFDGWASSHFEPLYFILNKIMGLFVDDAKYFILLESTVTIGLVFRFIAKHSSSPFYSVLLFQTVYFYCAAFNVSRFWLGLSIALIGYDYVKTNKLCRAFIFVCMGALIHTSLVLLFFVYFFLTKVDKVSDSTVIIASGLVVVLSAFADQIAALFAILVPRYAVYLSLHREVSSGLLFPVFLIIIVIMSLVFMAKDQDGSQARDARKLGIVVVCGAAILIMGGSVPEAVRVAQLFTVFLLIFIPEVGYSSPKGKLFEVGVTLLTLAYYVVLLSSNSSEIIPYSSWLFV